MNISKTRSTLVAVLVLTLGFSSQAALPAIAAPIAECVNGVCTVTFNFTGSLQSWTPPAGAKKISFEAYGAQGGRTGGFGGKVSGQLSDVPETLWIAVGGAGSSASLAQGGFNGGGRAGSGSGVEGSGGGATDLRLSTAASSRIVVAGGGGGRGAGIGANGGSGGGLIAQEGKNGQAMGGGGGTQIAGGAGGARNGSGTSGTAGSLSQGGNGGTSTLYGGGGGGGGYFGGGGGGSDTDACCSDSGGGGGGSSYTDSALVQETVHEPGVRSGAGLLIVRYEIAPRLEEFVAVSATSTNQSASFSIRFSQPVTEIEESDFEILHDGQGCTQAELTGSEFSYQLTLSGCLDGSVSIAIEADSVLGTSGRGPENRVVSESVLLDSTAPVAFWQLQDLPTAQLEFSEPVTGLNLSSFELESSAQDCSVSSLNYESESLWQISLIGCDQTSYSLTLKANSVADTLGNLGPVEATSFSFEAPEPTPEPEVEAQPEEQSDFTDDQDFEPGGEGGGVVDEQVPVDPDLPKATEQEPILTPEPNLTSNGEALGSLGPLSYPQSLEREEQDNSDLPGQQARQQILTPPRPLNQAAQTVIIPNQEGRKSPGLKTVFIALGVIGAFGLVAGLTVVRRFVPGMIG